MKNQLNAMLLTAALTGLIGGTVAAMRQPAQRRRHHGQGCQGRPALHQPGQATKHSCKGKNDCKGNGGCKSSDNGCKGKNSCKGKGGCATDGSKMPKFV